MKRRTVLGAVGGLAVLGGGGYVGWELFAPERATRVNEERAMASVASGAGGESGTETGNGDTGGVQLLKTGEFVGKDNHRCSGTVELARDDAGPFLQFRDYDQTQGPDVFCYLTPDADPDTTAAIDAGVKVLVDGGADGGEMTKTGTFVQPLSNDTDVERMNGVGIWCDRFSVPFGAATLSAPPDR
ncbi:hypothetical protein C2R22_08670 [Salinigranum rubrum]|uniref:DM13 domain-containing protein n=1 Tax=Salinigranum rubrum TaxID=755307 RepID=A0A2I8VIF5_9EURY|nr:DM13 domain-containing protein [Salinigranum rubrum]AUV81712.1 hypothetical protein C2R22_08670 [Salinigranum rubrum]